MVIDKKYNLTEHNKIKKIELLIYKKRLVTDNFCQKKYDYKNIKLKKKLNYSVYI